MDQYHPSAEELKAHQDLTSDLLHWAFDVHYLVRERFTALQEAYGRYTNPSETLEEYTGRCLADGQHPFPPGTSIYDDDNSSVAYDRAHVEYGIRGDGPMRVTFEGRYPHWAPDGKTYELRTAFMHVPSWVLSDPDGVDRYRTETAYKAGELATTQAIEDEKLHAMLDQVLADHAAAKPAADSGE